MLENRIAARRIDAEASLASARMAEVRMDTDGIAGSPDAFNPAELLLADIPACIRGIEWVTLMPDFNLDGGKVSLHAVRPDAPPKIVSAAYELVAHTDERDQRPELLHKKVRKYDTISNTISAAAPLDGTIRRKT